MDLNHTGCCAVLEIDGLSGCKGPEQAMSAVVELLFEEGGGEYEDIYRYPQRKKKTKVPVPGFILFTGVVSCKCGDNCETGYGEQFEAFLRKEKLGVVKASAPRPNRLNHPSHKVKVWTWCPNPRGVTAWWKKREEGNS